MNLFKNSEALIYEPDTIVTHVLFWARVRSNALDYRFEAKSFISSHVPYDVIS